MKRIFSLLLLLVAIFSVYWFFFRSKKSGHSGPKQAPIELKKHSDAFNARVDSVINAYMMAKDAFVDDDTAQAKNYVSAMVSLLDSIPLDELKSDTATIMVTVQANINDIKANAHSMLQQHDISEMRQDFSMVTENMYPSFFRAINYEGSKIFLQHCPMAFGENRGANWLSKSTEIMNPYLGKNHPTYKSSMLHCGEVKDTIKAQ